MALEVTPMDVKMLLATLPEEANLAAWCRQLGVSRPTAYKWRARYRAEGLNGLQDRSRAPRRPAGRTDPSVEDRVVFVRKQLAEEGFDHGPASVRDRLVAEDGVVVSDATVWRILTRRGQITAQPAKRPRSSWRRWERSRPNECWQGDDTHYVLVGGQEVRIINLLDDHSRLNVDSLAAAHCRSPRIWEAFTKAVERYGVPAEFLSDNGRAWRSADGFARTMFQAGLTRLNVRDIHSSPYHPQTCGKVERFHQTQRRWLDAQPQAATVAQLQVLLDRFRQLYNDHRPHRGVGRRTPTQVWSAQPPAAPPQIADAPTPTIARCVVLPDGRISAGNTTRIGLGAEWAGHRVTVIRRGDHATVIHNHTGEIIRELTIDRTRNDQGTGRRKSGTRLPRKPQPDPDNV
jgi:transposase InsO family protein